MNNRFSGAMMALAAVMALASIPVAGQAPAGTDQAYTPPRTPDGQPDMQGFWGAVPLGTFNIQDLEFQSRYQQGKPDESLRGKSRIVDPPDGKIPYQPWAVPKAKILLDSHLDPTPDTLDPNARCFLPGVPRQIYNNEFEILQPPGYVVIFNAAHHTFRVIPLDGRRPHPGGNVKLWMGDSRGHWEGNTLVVDVTNHNDQTWFDLVGSFHSDALHVTERFTFADAGTILYETTIEDPKVFTRSWKMAIRLERRKDYEGGVELWEQACFEGNERSLKGMLNRPGR